MNQLMIGKDRKHQLVRFYLRLQVDGCKLVGLLAQVSAQKSFVFAAGSLQFEACNSLARLV
jgi:hypothetical protein